MKIRELKIQNFRGFTDQPVFAFGDHFTVIAGVNGKGKTAILDAIATVCSRLLLGISPARGGGRTIQNRDVHYGTDSASIQIKFSTPIGAYDYGLRCTLNPRKQTEEPNLLGQVKKSIWKSYGDPDTDADAAPIVVYYTTDRAGYRIPRELPKVFPHDRRAAYTGALVNRTVNFRDLMARYHIATTLAAEFEGARAPYFGQAAMDAIAGALTTFLGGYSNLRVQESPLQLLVDKGEIPLDISQLSDGERSFLAIVCDLSRRLALANPQIDNPLLGEGVVLIDEIELHLHPRWQREVTEKLRTTFPKIQFIATTHSPFVIQSLREGELINLDGDVDFEPAGRTIEEVARYIMGVTNTERGERYERMLNVARTYLSLADRFRYTTSESRTLIQQQLTSMLAPYADNPAYVALLERKGLIDLEYGRENDTEADYETS